MDEPKKLGPFEIVELIGSGGMGEVFEGLDIATGQRVAIKRVKRDLAPKQLTLATKKLEGEARALATLRGGHAPLLFGFGTGPPAWLAMELLQGETLAAALARRPMDVSAALATLIQIAHVVELAHRGQLVHRDLKPENVFLSRSGLYFHPVVVKVIDWGIVADLARGQGSTRIFTPHYAAPEQYLEKGSDEKADIFAFGLLAFHCIFGRAYFDSKSAAKFAYQGEAHRPESPSRRVTQLEGREVVPTPEFESWFLRSTSHDAKERFSSVQVAMEALGHACGLLVAQAGATRPMTTLLNPSSRPIPPAVAATVEAAPSPPTVEIGVAPIVESAAIQPSHSPARAERGPSFRVLAFGGILAIGLGCVVWLGFDRVSDPADAIAWFNGLFQETPRATPPLQSGCVVVPFKGGCDPQNNPTGQRWHSCQGQPPIVDWPGGGAQERRNVLPPMRTRPQSHRDQAA